jgi:hypothetical protein
VCHPNLFHGDAEIVFNRIRQESQMYSSLTAVVLCIAMQGAAAAQCATPDASAGHKAPGVVEVAKKTAPASAQHAGGELIKTASAGTHDEVPGISRGSRTAVTGAQDDDDPHRRGSPAMLWAALALMSGIALRRFGAHRQ